MKKTTKKYKWKKGVKESAAALFVLLIIVFLWTVNRPPALTEVMAQGAAVSWVQGEEGIKIDEDVAFFEFRKTKVEGRNAFLVNISYQGGNHAVIVSQGDSGNPVKRDWAKPEEEYALFDW